MPGWRRGSQLTRACRGENAALLTPLPQPIPSHPETFSEFPLSACDLTPWDRERRGQRRDEPLGWNVLPPHWGTNPRPRPPGPRTVAPVCAADRQQPFEGWFLKDTESVLRRRGPSHIPVDVFHRDLSEADRPRGGVPRWALTFLSEARDAGLQTTSKGQALSEANHQRIIAASGLPGLCSLNQGSAGGSL